MPDYPRLYVFISGSGLHTLYLDEECQRHEGGAYAADEFVVIARRNGWLLKPIASHVYQIIVTHEHGDRHVHT